MTTATTTDKPAMVSVYDGRECVGGQKRDTVHMIKRNVAELYLPPAKIMRLRLALATKPHDIFFLAHVPTQNLDNSWNATNLQACEKAKTLWTQVTSRKGEGIDSYKVDFARHAEAFPEPKWPSQSLDELIYVTFAERMIADKCEALNRLIGDKSFE